MRKIKVLISGCNSQMGQNTYNLIKKVDDMEIIAGFDTAAREFPTFPVFENVFDLITSYSEDENIRPDVVIDFSSPECTINILKHYAHKYGIPMVIATTNFSKEELEIIENYSSEVPIFMLSNMSSLRTFFVEGAIRFLIDIGHGMYEISSH